MATKYIQDIGKVLEDEVKAVVSFINSHEIEIGVVDASSARKSVKVGINNAELMFIHENGSPLRKIPARPVLDMTLKYTTDTLLKDVYNRCVEGVLDKGWSNEDVEKELNKLCIRMQNYARDIIYSNDGRLKPNAPSTEKRKGYNHPLFQTGQLARSITCRLVKK